jgi:NAD(P)-dependent dehydrogenase (short-subunit alcohol dehydrogenase family)
VRWTLQNKTAVVTGGTKGIGKAIVSELLTLGANVIVIARNENDLLTCVNEWKQSGYTVKSIAADVTNYEAYPKILDQITNTKIDILINNVGGNFPKKFIDYTTDDIHKIFNLNLISVIKFTQSMYEKLKASGNASVINISSIAGFEDVGTGSMYAMCKAALIQLTKSISVEWAPFNIRVNSIAPWFTSTERINTLLQDDALKNFVLKNTPLNRVANPNDVASAAAFLAMDAASYITGETIMIDGGYMANQ